MLNNFKKLFKLNNWKRLTIVIFSFIFISLFAGLSLGLYSKKTTPTTDFKNGINVVVKPSYESQPIENDENYINQIKYNLSERLSYKYDNNINITNNNGTFDIKITDIYSDDDKNSFINFLTKKEELVITSSEHLYGNKSFFDRDVNSLFVNTTDGSTKNSYNLVFAKSGSDFKSKEVYNQGSSNQVSKVIIWKNFSLLQDIIKSNINDPISNDIYKGSLYRYLFVDGKIESTTISSNNDNNSENNNNNNNAISYGPWFKEELNLYKLDENGEQVLDKNGNAEIIKKYKPSDFLVSINNLDEFNNKESLNVIKDFGVKNWTPSKKDVQNEKVNVNFWISDYNYNNYVFSKINAQNAPYPIFIISIVTFFALVSIFVVINYGYLGIIAILLLSIIVFLSLIMITVLIGDYDTTTLLSIITCTIISLDFIILFFEKIKKEITKGNSISKSVKNTIKFTNKNDYIKAILLSISLAIVYALLSSSYGIFSAIVMTVISVIPIVILLFLRTISKVFVNIKWFENNKRTIGYWKKDIVITNTSNDVDEEDEILLNQIKNERSEETKIENSKAFLSFNKVNRKSLKISLLSLAYLIFGGIAIFLISFFRTNNGFTKNQTDLYPTVLKISPNNNELTNEEKKEVENDITKILDIKSNQIDTSTNIISVYLENDFDQIKINKLESVLISKYNVKTINSELTNSNTFNIMKNTMYGILIAIIAMTIFVLIWMNWAKALIFFIMSIIYLISIFTMMMFGLVSISPIMSSILFITFALFLLSTLNSLIRYQQKFKTKKIYEMDKQTIKKIVDLVTFKNLKSTLTIGLINLLAFSIFVVFFNVLPIAYMLFIIGFVVVNTTFNIFLLPYILTNIEAAKARKIRNRIINQFWETEKVHEQAFSEINNIKY